jgi:hypothetical protein
VEKGVREAARLLREPGDGGASTPNPSPSPLEEEGSISSTRSPDSALKTR